MGGFPRASPSRPSPPHQSGRQQRNTHHHRDEADDQPDGARVGGAAGDEAAYLCPEVVVLRHPDDGAGKAPGDEKDTGDDRPHIFRPPESIFISHSAP